MTILTDSFIPLLALSYWLRIQVVDHRFILNNKLWNKFLQGHVGIVWQVLQKLVHSSGVSISISAYLKPKVKANTILILFWSELGQASNDLITPRIKKSIDNLFYRQ